MATVAERVQRGIELLDAEGPNNWRERIDISTFKIRSACGCVLGQVFMDEGLNACETDWEYGLFKAFDSTIDPSYFGFEATGSKSSHLVAEDWKALQAEWIRRLTE